MSWEVFAITLDASLRRGNMWYLRVQYTNNSHDIVPATMLNRLISSEQIIRFYRPSEKRWVKLGLDPIRKERCPYDGPERRKID